MLAFSAFIAGAGSTALAAGGQLQVGRGPGGYTLALGDAAPFYSTPRPVLNARLMNVSAEGDEQLTLWDESQPDGSLQSYYAIRLAGEPVPGHVRATDYRVRLQYEEFDPAARLPAIAERLTAPPGSEIHLVQFVVPPLDSFRQQIGTLGGTILHFLPDHVYVVRMPAPVRERVAALPYVRWVGPYHPAYKLEISILPLLLAPDSGVAARYSIEVFERGPRQEQAVAQRITALGGVVEFTVPEGFRLEATLTPAQLLEIARMDEVNFIDRWGGPAEADMDIARQIGGANFIEGTCGFNGQGVRAEVMDLGLRVTHLAFQNPAPLIHGINTGDTQHGTSTYGIVFGNGAANMAGRGMLPGRQQGIFAAHSILVGFGGTVTRYVHTAQLVDPDGPYRAVLQSNSWGSISQTTLYTSVSAEMDDILFLDDIVITQSQGNNNSQTSRPQAWAKNVVSCGGVNHHNTLTKTDDNWAGASIGPASDGRIKPNFTHFYDLVLCPTNFSDTAYTTTFSGTSAATPITAGHFGIMFQMWHEGVFAGFGGGASVFADRPHLATARALLINSGSQYPFSSSTANLSRFKQGWGL
ncbi:MAG TPA: S8 family serine peptidase, partial [Phycisphaerae bacterium]